MQKTSVWNLYVSAYTFLLGLPTLFFTNRVPVISFAPGNGVWVKVAGMCFLAFSFFNLVIYRERQLSMLWTNIVNQACFAIIVSLMAFLGHSALLTGIAGVIIAGVIGSAYTYRAERQSYSPRAIEKMPKTARWNVYVTGYTLIYGLSTAVFPKQLLPLVGFPMPEGGWVRISGICFLALCFFNILTYLERGSRTIIWAIMIVRIWFVGSLAVMGLLGYPPFVFVSAAIVSVGVVGTALSYRAEIRSRYFAPASS